MAQFHFVEDYEKYVAQLIEKHPINLAMEIAVGGSYTTIGNIEADIIVYSGFKTAKDFLISGAEADD